MILVIVISSLHLIHSFATEVKLFYCIEHIKIFQSYYKTVLEISVISPFKRARWDHFS